MKVEELKHELAQLKPLTHAQVEDKDSQLTNMKHHNGKGRKKVLLSHWAIFGQAASHIESKSNYCQK